MKTGSCCMNIGILVRAEPLREPVVDVLWSRPNQKGIWADLSFSLDSFCENSHFPSTYLLTTGFHRIYWLYFQAVNIVIYV